MYHSIGSNLNFPLGQLHISFSFHLRAYNSGYIILFLEYLS